MWRQKNDYLFIFIYLFKSKVHCRLRHAPTKLGRLWHWLRLQTLKFVILSSGFYLFLSIELHSAYYKNETFLFCFPKRSSRLRLSAQSDLKIGSGAALKSAAPAPAPQHWIIEKVSFLEKILGWGFLLFSGQNLNFLKIWSIFDDVGPHQFH